MVALGTAVIHRPESDQTLPIYPRRRRAVMRRCLSASVIALILASTISLMAPQRLSAGSWHYFTNMDIYIFIINFSSKQCTTLPFGTISRCFLNGVSSII